MDFDEFQLQKKVVRVKRLEIGVDMQSPVSNLHGKKFRVSFFSSRELKI
jgi:hypothetical protein